MALCPSKDTENSLLSIIYLASGTGSKRLVREQKARTPKRAVQGRKVQNYQRAKVLIPGNG
jgi:hypothetical protein